MSNKDVKFKPGDWVVHKYSPNIEFKVHETNDSVTCNDKGDWYFTENLELSKHHTILEIIKDL